MELSAQVAAASCNGARRADKDGRGWYSKDKNQRTQQPSVQFEELHPIEPPHRTSDGGLLTGADLGQDLSMPTAGLSGQDIFSSLDLFMADIPFLPF